MKNIISRDKENPINNNEAELIRDNSLQKSLIIRWNGTFYEVCEEYGFGGHIPNEGGESFKK